MGFIISKYSDEFVDDVTVTQRHDTMTHVMNFQGDGQNIERLSLV